MGIQLEVAEDPARECAAMLLGAALAGGHIVLSGGSTPRRAYQELVKAARTVHGDLSRATFWFGDERCVPPDDERSNYGMASRALLDPLGLSGSERVVRMEGELGPDAAAERYEQRLRAAGTPEFAVVLVGIGPDGHTLSLFPGKPAVQERSRLVVSVPEAGLEPFVPRVSFTLGALREARQVVLLAEGTGKAEALARAFGPGAEPTPEVPASLLPTVAPEVMLLLDSAAAAGLERP